MTEVLEPLNDKVVIIQDMAEDCTKSGIFIPDQAKEKPIIGTVQSVGPGSLLDSGERCPMSVKPGDKVVFAKYSGNDIKLDGQEFLIVKERDILAIVT